MFLIASNTLFVPDKTYSLQEASDIFRKAKWKGLTSKVSVSNLLNEVYHRLHAIAKDSMNNTPLENIESGESIAKSNNRAFERKTHLKDLDACRTQNSFVAHKLLFKAFKLRILEDKLNHDVRPECVAQDPDYKMLDIDDGRVITPQAKISMLRDQVAKQQLEIYALNEELRKNAKPGGMPTSIFPPKPPSSV